MIFRIKKAYGRDPGHRRKIICRSSNTVFTPSEIILCMSVGLGRRCLYGLSFLDDVFGMTFVYSLVDRKTAHEQPVLLECQASQLFGVPRPSETPVAQGL